MILKAPYRPDGKRNKLANKHLKFIITLHGLIHCYGDDLLPSSGIIKVFHVRSEKRESFEECDRHKDKMYICFLPSKNIFAVKNPSPDSIQQIKKHLRRVPGVRH